jgi:hypothetical protein
MKQRSNERSQQRSTAAKKHRSKEAPQQRSTASMNTATTFY